MISKRNLSLAVLILGFAVPAVGAEVDRREARQQERIAEGVENGSLTPRETANLEHREAKIHNEIQRDRAANGGHLTRAQRAKINREQNRTSRAIYRKKHNAQHR
jgi:hypothetical protein